MAVLFETWRNMKTWGYPSPSFWYKLHTLIYMRVLQISATLLQEYSTGSWIFILNSYQELLCIVLCIDQVSKSERTDRSARITSSFHRILSCLASFMIPLNTASTMNSSPIGAHKLQGQPPIIGVLVNHLLCLLHRSNVFGTTKGPVLQYLAIALSTKRSNRKWVLDGTGLGIV